MDRSVLGCAGGWDSHFCLPGSVHCAALGDRKAMIMSKYEKTMITVVKCYFCGKESGEFKIEDQGPFGNTSVRDQDMKGEFFNFGIPTSETHEKLHLVRIEICCVDCCKVLRRQLTGIVGSPQWKTGAESDESGSPEGDYLDERIRGASLAVKTYSRLLNDQENKLDYFERLKRRVDILCKRKGVKYRECLRCRMDKEEQKTCDVCTDRPKELPERIPSMRGSSLIQGYCVHGRYDESACVPCIFKCNGETK